MSEFSESYHLRTERIQDAIELLRRANLKGYVFKPANGWVTFLAEEGTFEPDSRIVDAARQLLLHYASAEDHGWSFALFDQGDSVTRYSCEWDDDINFTDYTYSREALLENIPSADPALLTDFETHLCPADIDELFETEPSKLFARALGLEHYDWLSYDYVDRNFSDYPDITRVE